MKKLILALGCLLVATGCDITDNGAFQFSFTVTPLDAAPATPAAATINTDTPGLVKITGDSSTPCADQNVRFSGSRSGSELRVTINRLAGGACSGGTRWFSYTAIMSLPSGGTYHLIMTDVTSGTTVTVLDQTVVVNE